MTLPGGARALALEAIRRVIDEGAYSNLLIPSLLGRSGLDQRDRAFVSEMAYGTLRRLLVLDRAIEAKANRPVDRMSPGARHALRLGAYQLFEMHVPPHAAVGETVELVGGREKGFVNAVLRKLASGSAPVVAGVDDKAVSARTGLAPWAVRELRSQAGDDVERAAAALAERGPLTLRVNTCRTTTDALARALRDAGHEPQPGAIARDCLVLEKGDPATLPGFAEGWFTIQDQASAFVVQVLDPQPGERVVDVCAAPGGKTLATACLVQPDGVVVAADLASRRLGLIRRTADRLGLEPILVAQDGASPALTGPFDRVLVDAPCSGIGSARRRPELLWRVPKERLSQLARRQVAISAAVADLLKPGGRLVYSVCTFPRAETDAACDAIQRHRPDLRPIETSGPDGDVARHRLWPHLHGTDGMFVAAFERIA
jgi:16S rRNA (cytosine967-C5)-methyltransferase